MVRSGRFRNEAAFAALAGVSPIEASSGKHPPPTQPLRRPGPAPERPHPGALRPRNPELPGQAHR
ncbi:transposase [Nonomuraea angiospora]|uniref:transposase n=1 Tax=Nonomuraea angiospora TaxID=46172 RepID=UPI0037B25A05